MGPSTVQLSTATLGSFNPPNPPIRIVKQASQEKVKGTFDNEFPSLAGPSATGSNSSASTAPFGGAQSTEKGSVAWAKLTSASKIKGTESLSEDKQLGSDAFTSAGGEDKEEIERLRLLVPKAQSAPKGLVKLSNRQKTAVNIPKPGAGFQASKTAGSVSRATGTALKRPQLIGPLAPQTAATKTTTLVASGTLTSKGSLRTGKTLVKDLASSISESDSNALDTAETEDQSTELSEDAKAESNDIEVSMVSLDSLETSLPLERVVPASPSPDRSLQNHTHDGHSSLSHGWSDGRKNLVPPGFEMKERKGADVVVGEQEGPSIHDLRRRESLFSTPPYQLVTGAKQRSQSEASGTYLPMSAEFPPRSNNSLHNQDDQRYLHDPTHNFIPSVLQDSQDSTQRLRTVSSPAGSITQHRSSIISPISAFGPSWVSDLRRESLESSMSSFTTSSSFRRESIDHTLSPYVSSPVFFGAPSTILENVAMGEEKGSEYVMTEEEKMAFWNGVGRGLGDEDEEPSSLATRKTAERSRGVTSPSAFAFSSHHSVNHHQVDPNPTLQYVNAALEKSKGHNLLLALHGGTIAPSFPSYSAANESIHSHLPHTSQPSQAPHSFGTFQH
ncbi:hypothetical protein HDU97_008640 [Phlyctochytrium planicorne]|nr:hypothetical protein HDU97_008640 [Phlyctochytrium planicorne]